MVATKFIIIPINQKERSYASGATSSFSLSSSSVHCFFNSFFFCLFLRWFLLRFLLDPVALGVVVLGAVREIACVFCLDLFRQTLNAYMQQQMHCTLVCGKEIMAYNKPNVVARQRE